MSAANKPTTFKVSNTPVADAFEDDLVTWLQYPTDDSFERSHCSDVFQGWPLSVEAAITTHPSVAIPEHEEDGTIPCMQTSLYNETGSTRTRTSLATKHTGAKMAVIPRSSRNTSAEEALAQGAARAAGYSSQVGQDAYNKVRTIMQPTYAQTQPSIPCDSVSSCKGYKDHHIKPNLPLSAVPVSLPSSQQNARSMKLSILDSTPISSAKTPTSSKNFAAFKRARKDVEVHSHTHRTETSRITEEGTTGRGKMVELQRDTPLSYSAASQTSMSLSSREIEYSGKRKQEDSDFFSEEYANDDSVDMEKHAKPPSRRHRVAEVHNLSERNRRNRINDKLKTLQELIPNSTKTDKASVLDEAIEYMKTLQMQLQMVSMRNGMNVGTVMMPMTLPQAHVQMAQPHSIGLGVPIGHVAGMGMSFGTGMEIGPQTTTPVLHRQAAMNQHAIPFQNGSLAGITYMGFPQSTQISRTTQNMQEPYELVSQRLPYMHQIQQQEQAQPFLQHFKHEEPTCEDHRRERQG